ncbi:hypothetical protein BC940DRAFT_240700 [Gongronella butleri]|nr:hypothetical protein BC940DRAFT_240700 [Gongronella butleri]
MNEWTSEKLAKAIKGTGLCSDERVQLATRLWDDTHLFFPNKPDFLFDWLTMALAKPNLKK